jgi:hypothetical protein
MLVLPLHAFLALLVGRVGSAFCLDRVDSVPNHD